MAKGKGLLLIARQKREISMKLFSLLLATVLSQSPSKGNLPDPKQVYISRITHGGSGCPQRTVSVAFTSDSTAFTMIFDAFIAQSGSGIFPKDSRTACQINMDLQYPAGWAYSMVTVDYRGYTGIPSGVTAVQRASYGFLGQDLRVVSRKEFHGPWYGDYQVTDTLVGNSLNWSMCNKTQRGIIRTAVVLLGNNSKPALITVDSLDKKVKQVYKLKWKRC